MIEPTVRMDPLITARELSKAFKKVNVIKNLSATFSEGERIGLG